MAQQIRQEIMIVQNGFSAASAGSATSNERVLMDTSKFTSPTFTFEIMAMSSVSLAFTVLLVGATDGTVATINVPLGTTAKVLFTTSFSAPATTSQEFTVQIGSQSGSTKFCNEARIVIIQNATTLTATETQIEVGALGTITALTDTEIGGVKFWTYNSANWDGITSVVFEAVFLTGTSKSAATVTLQADDGTWANWVNVASSALTTIGTTATRVRSSAITLTAGRNYRVVAKAGNSKSGVTTYCAKIIITQSSMTKLEPQYLVSPVSENTASLTGIVVAWDPASWSGVTNTYNAAFDIGPGTSPASNAYEIDTASGTLLTGSKTASTVVTDKQTVAGPVTMPTAQNLDSLRTGIAGQPWTAARILVTCTINAAAFMADFNKPILQSMNRAANF